MKVHHQKTLPRLLHWVLIAALALMPVGMVNAMADDCDMGHQAMSTSSDHHEHMMQSSATDENLVADACCCCDNASVCSADCDAGLQVGVIDTYLFERAIKPDDSYLASIADDLLIRALSPPSRPPAKIHS